MYHTRSSISSPRSSSSINFPNAGPRDQSIQSMKQEPHLGFSNNSNSSSSSTTSINITDPGTSSNPSIQAALANNNSTILGGPLTDYQATIMHQHQQHQQQPHLSDGNHQIHYYQQQQQQHHTSQPLQQQQLQQQPPQTQMQNSGINLASVHHHNNHQHSNHILNHDLQNQLHTQHHNHHHQAQHQHHPFGHTNTSSNGTIDSTTLPSSSLNHTSNKIKLDKNSEDYKKRRERNNVAVRKSREKAKMRSRETERRVAELSKENQLYRAQYEELRREFDVLKSLLLKTGLTEQVIEDEAQRHTTPIQQQYQRVVSNTEIHMVNNHHNVNGQSNVANQGAQHQIPYGSTSIDAVDQWDSINPYIMEHF